MDFNFKKISTNIAKNSVTLNLHIGKERISYMNPTIDVY